MNGSRILAVLLVVAGCAAAVYLAVLAVQSAAGWLSAAEPLVAASLLAAVTILLAARIVAGGLRIRSADDEQRRRARTELYEQILSGCVDERLPLEQAAAERLILSAGPQVIKRLLEFRDDPTPGRFENLCLAMRSDVGCGNLGIPSGGLAKLVRAAAENDERAGVRQWITSKHDGDS